MHMFHQAHARFAADKKAKDKVEQEREENESVSPLTATTVAAGFSASWKQQWVTGDTAAYKKVEHWEIAIK